MFTDNCKSINIFLEFKATLAHGITIVEGGGPMDQDGPSVFLFPGMIPIKKNRKSQYKYLFYHLLPQKT